MDIASQYYTYSFEPTDHWEHHYATQPEILQYLNDVMARYQIADHVRFDTEVDRRGLGQGERPPGGCRSVQCRWRRRDADRPRL